MKVGKRNEYFEIIIIKINQTKKIKDKETKSGI